MHIGSYDVEKACCSKSRNKLESANIPESWRLPSERIKTMSFFFRNKLRNSLSFPHQSEFSPFLTSQYIKTDLSKSQEPTLHRAYGIPTFAT